MISDGEWAGFDAWCSEVAKDIRIRAVAMGQTVEYAFLRRATILWREMAEKCPTIGNAMFDSVERACYDHDYEPNLDAINKYRASIGFPPLTVLPPLRMKEDYKMPMPEHW